MRAAKRRRGRPRLRERRARGMSGESSLYRRSRMPGGRDRGPRNARPACRRRGLSAALVHWKKSPAALFRTSASFSLAKSVVFASCIAGGIDARASVRAAFRRCDALTIASMLPGVGRKYHQSHFASRCHMARFKSRYVTKRLNRPRFPRRSAIAPPATARDRPDDRCVRRAPRRPGDRTARRETDPDCTGQPGR
jgi:hypothetical protein